MIKAPIQHQLVHCIEILTRHLEAENRHDLKAIMETYGENPEVYINGDSFIGTSQIEFFHERFGFGGQGAFSEVRVREKKRYISDDSIIIEQELSGIHSSQWQGHDPTGKKFTISVCTIYSFDEEAKLSGEDVYFDSYLLRKQLGLLPIIFHK